MKRSFAEKFAARAVHHTLAIVIVGACVLSVSSMTAAAADVGAPQATIRYSDLNLATPEGVTALYARINRAGYDVCQSFGRDRSDLPDPLALEHCRRQIMADAVRKIDKPALYAMVNRRNVTPPRTQIAAASSRQ